MGRPIKKINFGTPIGGDKVSTTVGVTNTGSFYASTATLAFSLPSIPGGTRATGDLTIVDGYITAVTVTAQGSGYTAAPTITVTPATTGTTATFAVTLAATADVAIQCNAFVPGGSAGMVADIVKQKASRRYRVTTADGTGVCKLVDKAIGDLLEGEMNIIATKADSGSFRVAKLTERRVVDFSGNVYHWSLTTTSTDGGGGVPTVEIGN